MKLCYLCQNKLTEHNKSREHIFPNSVGGKLYCSNLICKKCNNTCGKEIDDELSHLTNVFASKWNIKRDHGQVPKLTATMLETDERVVVEPGWKTRILEPRVEKTADGFIITTGTRKRLLQEGNRLRKNFPSIDLAKLADDARCEIGKGNHNIQFDCKASLPKVMRAIAKICVNHYLYKGHDEIYTRGIALFIKGGGDNNYAWIFNVIFGKQVFPKDVIHIATIHGMPDQHILYGYVELFSTMSFVVLLNDSYDGPAFDDSYIYSPLKRMTLNYDIKVTMQREGILTLIKSKPNPNALSIILNKREG